MCFSSTKIMILDNDARNGGAMYGEKQNTLAITDCVFSSKLVSIRVI